VDTGGDFPGGKADGAADHSAHLVPTTRMVELYFHSPIRIVTYLIKTLPDNGSLNTFQYAPIEGKLFSTWSAPSKSRTTALCSPFLGNGSVNTFPFIGPCYATR
jgi:hypothetical protein